MSLIDTYKTRKEEWTLKKQEHRKVQDLIWSIALLIALGLSIYIGQLKLLWFIVPCLAYKIYSFVCGVIKGDGKETDDEEWAEKAVEYKPTVQRFHRNKSGWNLKHRQTDYDTMNLPKEKENEI